MDYEEEYELEFLEIQDLLLEKQALLNSEQPDEDKLNQIDFLISNLEI